MAEPDDRRDDDWKYHALATAVEDAAKPGTKVIYAADVNHYRVPDLYSAFLNPGFLEELGKNGKDNVIALELYSTSKQPLFDALRNYDITRDEFTNLMKDDIVSKQISSEEYSNLTERIADALEKGIHIVGANNGAAMGGEHQIRADTELAEISLESVHRFRDMSGAFDNDPQSLALHLLEEGDAKAGAMSEDQRKDYLRAKKEILNIVEKNGNITQDHIAALLDVTNPRYATYIHELNQAEKPSEDLKIRRARDYEVAATVQNYADQPDTRVLLLYGAMHAKGPDGLMAIMQQNGLQPELIVPLLGKDEFKCSKVDIKDCLDIQNDPFSRARVDKEMEGMDYTRVPDIKNAQNTEQHKTVPNYASPPLYSGH